MSRPDPSILLIRFGRFGDIVLSLGVADAIKKTFPKSNITLLTDTEAKDLVLGQPSLNNIVYWDRTLWKNINKIKAIFCILKAILELRKDKFDIAIDLQGFFETAFITYLVKAKKRIGYNEKLKRIFYNIKVNTSKVHDFIWQLKLAEPIGVNINNAKLSVTISNESKNYRDIFLRTMGLSDKLCPIVGINPGASVDYKRWDERNFAELSDKLIEKYKVKVIIFWGPKEEDIAKAVRNLMKNEAIICCRTNLMELSAFIERCNIFITNDTAGMHIASALDIPVLAIFIRGHSFPEISGPIGDKKKVFVVDGKGKHQILDELVTLAGTYL